MACLVWAMLGRLGVWQEMEVGLGQAGPRRPREGVSILLEGNGEPRKDSEQGRSKIPVLLVVVSMEDGLER